MSKSWWNNNVVLIFGGVLLGICLCEISLRFAGISYPSFYQPDSELGASLRPGAEGWWMREGKTYVKINSAGLRDREHARAKPPGTVRIAVLGDSFPEATQVPMEEAFWSVLERQLSACPAMAGRHPEAINFGVSGYGTAQELLMLRHRVWSYDPDIVLLAFSTHNDVRNNSRALEEEDLKPYFLLQDGTLVPDLTFRDSPVFRFAQTQTAQWKHRIMNSFRIYQVFDEARRIVKARMTRMKQGQVSPFAVQSVSEAQAARADSNVSPWDSFAEAGLDSMVYQRPRDPVWEGAWELTERLIIQMRNEVLEKGAGFIVVTLSSGPQVHPDPAVRRDLANHLGMPDLLYPDVRIRDLGDREGFSVLNLAPLLQVHAENHQEYLHFTKSGVGVGHWNKAGHRLAGELIAQKVCADLPKPPARS
jgi:hypothetical protein